MSNRNIICRQTKKKTNETLTTNPKGSTRYIAKYEILPVSSGGGL